MITNRPQIKNNPDKPDIDKSAQKIFVQIYEIQTPQDAETMIELGVDRMGSVILSQEEWKVFEIREAMGTRRNTPVKSSLIPLFSHPDVIYRVVDFYQPDIIHFCESLISNRGISDAVGNLIALQEGFRKRFPEIEIMRSIPVGQDGRKVPSSEAARLFEAVSDYFLLDTIFDGGKDDLSADQPEAGFVGITGKICDWDMAAKLVEKSPIPVVLAGGISPENVFDAIVKVRPSGVDSCTNTNATDPKGIPIRFKKDPEKIRRLIEAVQKAQAEIKQ
jgi:phosphoribosylanthranilate isomerase